MHLVSAKPRVWREIFVPSDLTLDRLHVVLQAAMGWEGRSLHHFQVEPFRERRAMPFRTAAEPGDPSVPDECAVRVDEVLAEPGDLVHYLYDPGDRWQHVIRLEDVFPAMPAPLGIHPTCVDGGGRCPVEGIGGVFDRRAASRRIRQWLAAPPIPAPSRGDAPVPHRADQPWVARPPAPGMVAFSCVLDARIAGRVGIVGGRRDVVVETPWGAMEHDGEASEAVEDGLTVVDAGYLHFLDPAFAPFWCPACEAVYCGDHWGRWVVEGRALPDGVWGACPRGHERLLR